jgi:hypothetical protein
MKETTGLACGFWAALSRKTGQIRVDSLGLTRKIKTSPPFNRNPP